MSRSGTLIAAVLLVVAAIVFAPRAGEHRPTRAPTPSPATPPTAAPMPTADPSPPGGTPTFVPRPGLVDLKPLLDRIPRDDLLETMPDEAWRKLDDFAERHDRQGTRAEYEQISAWLRETTDHAARLRADRAYRDAWRIITNRRHHPILSDHEFVIATRPPWLVFVEKGEGAQALADRSANYLVQLSDVIHRLVGKRFDLPRITNAPYEAERVLTVTVFRDERAFHEYFRRIGQPLAAGNLSIYERSLNGGFLYRRVRESEDEWCHRLFYPAVHQALHVFTKVRLERDAPDRGELGWGGRGMHSKLHWFREGLVELLRSTAVAPDGTVSVGHLDREALGEWRQTRLAKQEEWPLATLLKIPDRRVLMQRALEIGLHPTEAGRLGRLFGIQSCLFFHFLWNHEDPNYRERLIEYLGMELHGRTGYKCWTRVWGDGKGDGAELAKEFEAWLLKISKE